MTSYIKTFLAWQKWLESNLKYEFRNLITLTIRKQIKEYVFKIFKSLTALYPNATLIEDNIYLNTLIKDPNSLKSFLNSIKQNINFNLKSPVNVVANLTSNNSLNNKSRKGKGGRYTNDFKNSFMFKNKNNENSKHFHDSNEKNISDFNGKNNLHLDNLKDTIQNGEIEISENPNLKIRKFNRIIHHSNDDLNLSLNEDNSNKINSNGNLPIPIHIKGKRGRKKLNKNINKKILINKY